MLIHWPTHSLNIFVQYPHCKKNPLFHSEFFWIVYIWMMRVLHLQFCCVIPLRLNKTYSINPILRPNTPMRVLHIGLT
jgi:hypothetical protein